MGGRPPRSLDLCASAKTIILRQRFRNRLMVSRAIAAFDAQHVHHLRRPLHFHLRSERLKKLHTRTVHDAWTKLRCRRLRTLQRYQRLDKLAAETNNAIRPVVRAGLTSMRPLATVA